MKIALFGYGKMGQMLERIALDRHHKIVAKIDEDTHKINFEEIDVAIDFSMPSAAFHNISKCLSNNTPVISGTTGWLDKYDDAVALCHKTKGAFIYASNFSLGVNIFFELNEQLAKMMKQVEQYAVTIEEIHHTQKLDAPSGTAITLAEGIIAHSDYKGWNLEKNEGGHIPISSKRIGTIPGTHTIAYNSQVDTISLQHTAHNRQGFAEGAIIAAEWIYGKTGVFTMRDVLNLG